MRRALAALAALTLALAACGSAPAHHAPTAAQRAAQRTAKGCRMLARWENGNASDTIQQDPVSVLIVEAAGGTKFARDFSAWVNAPVPSSFGGATGTILKADKVAADCRKAGVTIPGLGG